MTPSRDTTAIYSPKPAPGFIEWEPGSTAGIVFDVATISVAVGYILLSINDLGIGSPDDPGPGFFPLVAGLLVVLCLTLDLIRRLVVLAREGKVKGAGRVSWQVVGILGAIAFYLLTAGILGHMLSASVMVSALLLMLGNRAWYKAVAIDVLAAVLSDLLFTTLLGLRLPAGLLGIGWSQWI